MKFDFTPYTHTDISVTIEDTVFHCIVDQGFIRKNTITEDPHTHFSYELHSVYSGEYEVLVNQFSASFPIKYGSILIIPPECSHYSTKKDEQSEQICMYPIRFSFDKNSKSKGSLFQLIEEVLPKTGGFPLYFQSFECCDIIDSLSHELCSNNIGSKELTEAYLTIFLSMLLRQIINPQLIQAKDQNSDQDNLKRKDNIASRIDKINAVIDRNFDQPLTIQTMAELLNLSPRQVNRFFSNHFGKPFHTVLTDQRMRRAEKMLISSKMPIDQIALKVGYSSPSAFYTVFKKYYYITPLEYRYHFTSQKK